MIEIDFDSPDFADLKENVLPRVIADSLKAAAEDWARREIPRRFTPRASLRYKWKARTKGYMLRKAKTQGHQNDMQFSGDLKRMALGGLRVTVNRRTLIVRVRFPVPDYAAIRRKSAGGVTLKQELVQMSQEELGRLRDAMQADVLERLKNDPKYRVKRKRRRV